MSRSSGTLSTILAIIGLLLPSFVLLWTGHEAVMMILAAGYLFVWGYYDIDIGWISSNDSGFHLFNLNWYLDPNNISQGSKLIDAYLNSLSVAIYPGNFGHSELALSGMIFGLSFIIIIIGVFFGFMRKNDPRISGLIYIIGAVVAFVALLLIWDNATNLSFIGGGVEDNFIPLPLGSILVLIAGIWNLIKS
ncbi:MAG: hypothetical protein ACFFFH_09765 [Candidatus Thorarchaeota archaeon]